MDNFHFRLYNISGRPTDRIRSYGPPRYPMGYVGRPSEPVLRLLEPMDHPLDPQGRPLDPEGHHLNHEGQHLDPAGPHLNPVGQHLDPAGQYLNSVGQHLDPAGQYLNPVGQHFDPVGQHFDPVVHHLDPVGHLDAAVQHLDPVGHHLDPGVHHLDHYMNSVGHHSGPVTYHLDHVGQHLEPVGQHLDPLAQHLESVIQHLDPVGHFFNSVRRPVDPVYRPGNPVHLPADSIRRLADYVSRPMDPLGRSMDPFGRPIGHFARTMDHVGHPMDSAEHPMEPIGRPVDHVRRSVDFVRRSWVNIRRPVGMVHRPSDPVYRPNHSYISRGRPITGRISQSRYSSSQHHFRATNGNRSFEPYYSGDSHDASSRRNQERSYSQSTNHLGHGDNTIQPNTPTIVYYSPQPPQPQPQPNSLGEFHSVSVLSGPFPISHIPGSHPVSEQFSDAPVVLGPFHLENIPFIPGTTPVHHIPYIPSPQQVPNCPVSYEADESDPNLTYPGYSVIVPVPHGAAPAVQIYIIPSNYLDGYTHVLIFEHGYLMPPMTHFIYSNNQNTENVRETQPQRPSANANNQHLQPEQNVEVPAIGLRIGRQPIHHHIHRGRNRMHNSSSRNEFGQNVAFRYNGQSLGNDGEMPRRPGGRNHFRENVRLRHGDRDRSMRSGRPLHSCGSNDPAHNCLFDQQRRILAENVVNVEASRTEPISEDYGDSVPDEKAADDGASEKTGENPVENAYGNYALDNETHGDPVEKADGTPEKKVDDPEQKAIGGDSNEKAGGDPDEKDPEENAVGGSGEKGKNTVKNAVPEKNTIGDGAPDKAVGVQNKKAVGASHKRSVSAPVKKTVDVSTSGKKAGGNGVPDQKTAGNQNKKAGSKKKRRGAKKTFSTEDKKTNQVQSVTVLKPPKKEENIDNPVAPASGQLTSEVTDLKPPSKIEDNTVDSATANKDDSTEEQETQQLQDSTVATPPADPIPSDEAPKESNQEGEGEGSSSTTKRKSRYRPSYNYLRNPRRDSENTEKVKIRNFDANGNRVPTYRQAAHYCTKYHEQQARKKLRQQRRDGVFQEDEFSDRTLEDAWLGDGTTTESDSDSSFLTDEGGDQTKPPNAKEMLAYYYEIKALKEEEKKKKQKK